MRKAVVTAALAAVGLGWGIVDRADAFCHKVRTNCIAYYPGLYSFAPCGYGYLPYVYPCQYRFPKYCGRRKACWRGYLSCASSYPYACGYGCGGGACGGCADGGCGWGDCGGCGAACGGGCAGCGDGCLGGCASGSAVDGTYETDSNTIYDGPAPAPEPAPEPPSAPAESDPMASHRQTGFRLTANTARDGTAAYNRGLRSYWDGEMTAALEAFDTAAAAEPDNALYQYFRALSFYSLHGEDAAGEWLAQAIEMERQSPIKNWGRRMERVQGAARLWVEQARRNAGLTR